MYEPTVVDMLASNFSPSRYNPAIAHNPIRCTCSRHSAGGFFPTVGVCVCCGEPACVECVSVGLMFAYLTADAEAVAAAAAKFLPDLGRTAARTSAYARAWLHARTRARTNSCASARLALPQPRPATAWPIRARDPGLGACNSFTKPHAIMSMRN